MTKLCTSAKNPFLHPLKQTSWEIYNPSFISGVSLGEFWPVCQVGSLFSTCKISKTHNLKKILCYAAKKRALPVSTNLVSSKSNETDINTSKRSQQYIFQHFRQFFHVQTLINTITPLNWTHSCQKLRFCLIFQQNRPFRKVFLHFYGFNRLSTVEILNCILSI